MKKHVTLDIYFIEEEIDSKYLDDSYMECKEKKSKFLGVEYNNIKDNWTSYFQVYNTETKKSRTNRHYNFPSEEAAAIDRDQQTIIYQSQKIYKRKPRIKLNFPERFQNLDAKVIKYFLL